MESCETCHYYREGFCKRRAPLKAQTLHVNLWPMVRAKDWCGEYKSLSVNQPTRVGHWTGTSYG